MRGTKPLFRADHAGRVLPPTALEEARAKRERREFAADAINASGEKDWR
jgi:hypothetical protein